MYEGQPRLLHSNLKKTTTKKTTTKRTTTKRTKKTTTDPYHAKDFYDEYYDDFFDYYDAEDYWYDHQK